MLNKNDPLIAAVQKVMETNQAERNAVAAVNEKFGVTDRRALPRERQHEWDSAYAKVLTEGVEALDELKGITSNTGARAGYMLKGIGSAIGAKLTGNKKTYDKRMKGLEGAKKKSEADTKKRNQDSFNNVEANKALKIMGRKTGYGKIYDKMFEEEALDEKIDPSKYSKKQQDLAASAGDKRLIDGPDLVHVRKHGGGHIGEAKKMKDDPCWDTHEMVGMKKGDGGKPVPNCVPVKEQDYSATQPSKMGLKPDYAPAGTTPDYAKPTTQTVNRAEKQSMPAGTVKEAVMNKIMKKLEEKKMTSAEIKKEKEIKKKVDPSGMKASMKNQYGEKKGERIYFKKIRKDAMKAAE